MASKPLQTIHILLGQPICRLVGGGGGGRGGEGVIEMLNAHHKHGQPDWE